MIDLERKHLSSEHIMSDEELLEAIRRINVDIKKRKGLVYDKFGLPITLIERILDFTAKELKEEGFNRDNRFDKKIHDNEQLTRAKRWWIKANIK